MFNRIRNRRGRQRTLAAARTGLGIESLEDRVLLSTVYVESNNPDLGENAVLAFSRNPSDGSLTQIGTYPTGGTGQFNLPGAQGPDDSDQEVVATPDGRFLFAVNQGSNSISSFSIGADGGLTLMGTFDSGGVQPDSLGISASWLYVANRGDATANQPGTVAPNYTGFFINDDGSLTPVPGSTVVFPVGTSPAQTLISPTGSFLFANIFGLPGSTDPQSNSIAPYLIQADGSLQSAPGGNASAPVDPAGLLGTAAHPTLDIVYAGLPRANQVGVFQYDATGQISFVASVPDQGSAACWCVVSGDGNYLYVATTGTDSIGVFSLADPLHPAQIQEFALSHVANDESQSADFQIAWDPSGQSLYAVNQSTNPTGTNHRGNQLHVLSIAADGTLSEPSAPIVFSPADVPANAHPQGVAIVRSAGGAARAVAHHSDLGVALFAFTEIQGTGANVQLPPLAPFIASDFQRAPDSREGLPFVVSPSARTMIAFSESSGIAGDASSGEHHDGQRLVLPKMDVGGLDALFSSNLGAGIPSGASRLPQGVSGPSSFI